MGKTLNHLIRHDIFASFCEGMDKHSMKAAGEGYGKVWSYSERAALLDLTQNLTKFIKSEYPHIRRIEDVNVLHTQSFLERKAAEGCTQSTLDTYRSLIGKLEEVCCVRGHKVEMAVKDRITATPGNHARAYRGAESVIKKDEYVKLIEYCEVHPSASGYAILLERQIGVRVSDMAYGVQIASNKLLIKSKGGKVCERTITPEIRQIISSEAFSRLCLRGDKVCMPKDASINRYLNRVQDKLLIERHSFHDLRRYAAQEKYDVLRNGGLGRQQALKEVSLWLNHGPDREHLVLKSYVGNAW